MEYPMYDFGRLQRLLGDRVLVEWEEKNENLLGGKLIVPDTKRAAHYTGVVLRVGENMALDEETEAPVWNSCTEDINVGDRVFFEQFSNFDKYQSHDGKKRYAILNLDAVMSIIPPRVKVTTDGGEFTDDE